MAKQTIENLESAATVRSKINSNFSELYSNKADKSHASESIEYGAASSSLYGHVKVTSGNGLSSNNGVLSMSAASTSQVGAVQLVDDLTSTYNNRALTAAQGKILNDSLLDKAPKSHASASNTYGVASSSVFGHIKVTASNGLNIADGVLSISAASTTNIGTVQLNNTLTSTSTTQALTAAQGKILYDNKAQAYSGTTTPSSSLGKDGDIYFLIS